MTAVVGILNKRGAAIAADSAVTRGRGYKYTKNGNKMVRMSNVVPISVMLTGNGAFLRTQWDIIIRHYRQHRGDVVHKTVEACVHDFFKYIADNHFFSEQDIVEQHIKDNIQELFKHADQTIDSRLCERDEDGKLKTPKGYQKAFLKILSGYRKRWSIYGVCPQFEDYTPEQFHSFAGNLVEDFLSVKCYEDSSMFFHGMYPKDVIDAISSDFEQTLMTMLTNRRRDANLIFTGFGQDQKYPSLVSATVFEGFDNRVNYHIRPQDIICISDETPVAICPFAQTDVVESVLRGVHFDFAKTIQQKHKDVFSFGGIFAPEEGEEMPDFNLMEFHRLLSEINVDDLDKKFVKAGIKYLDKNQKEWEKALEDYDLLAMAALAQSLIDLTGFHRILHFEPEGVGGPVDLAVITKNEGFTWLSRKSWYHHKDIGGQYGVLGV